MASLTATMSDSQHDWAWDLAVGGVNYSIPGNGGPECRSVRGFTCKLPINQSRSLLYQDSEVFPTYGQRRRKACIRHLERHSDPFLITVHSVLATIGGIVILRSHCMRARMETSPSIVYRVQWTTTEGWGGGGLKWLSWSLWEEMINHKWRISQFDLWSFPGFSLLGAHALLIGLRCRVGLQNDLEVSNFSNLELKISLILTDRTLAQNWDFPPQPLPCGHGDPTGTTLNGQRTGTIVFNRYLLQ